MVNTFTQEDGCPLPLVSFHRPYVVPGLLDAAERTIDGTICDISGGACPLVGKELAARTAGINNAYALIVIYTRKIQPHLAYALCRPCRLFIGFNPTKLIKFGKYLLYLQSECRESGQ